MPNEGLAAFIAGIVVGFAAGMAIMGALLTYGYRAEAIEANCGHYNQTSGDFEWGPQLVVPE